MLPVVWTAAARRDLHTIINYISDVDKDAALRLQERVEAVVLPLATYPYLYPQSRRMPFYREIVAHGRRKFPLS